MAGDPVHSPRLAADTECAGQRGYDGTAVTVSAVVTGTAIGVVLCVLNILVTFRSGSAFGGSALVALLGAAVLKLLQRLSWPRLFVVFSIASSGYLATAAFDSGIAAMYLGTGRIPPMYMLVGAALAANVAGIALGIFLAEIFVRRERLPYPTLQPAISFMANLLAERRAGVRLLWWSALAAGVVTAAALIGDRTTVPLYPGAPEFLGLAVSPLLVGLGALIGWRTTVWLLVGGVYSMTVWAVRERAGAVSYGAHLSDQWILPCGVGVIVGYALTSLLRIRIQVKASVDRVLRDAGRRAGWTAAIACACGIGLLVWRQGVIGGLTIGTLAVVLTVTFALFLCRAGGEIGIAPLAPVLYLSVIAFALAAELTTALLAAATVSCTGIAAVYYTYAQHVALAGPGGEPAIRRRDIVGSQLVGGVVGSLAGVVAIVAVIRAGSLGSSRFPAPLASSVGFLTTITGHHGPDHGLTLPIAGAAAAIGAGLAFTSALPTSLGLGVLLPVASTLAIGLGGALQWLMMRNRPDRKSFVETAASGLVIGEGVVMTFAVAAQALSH